jgi:hypothetical protein
MCRPYSPALRAFHPQKPDQTSETGFYRLVQNVSAVLSFTPGLFSSEARWDLGGRFFRETYIYFQ